MVIFPANCCCLLFFVAFDFLETSPWRLNAMRTDSGHNIILCWFLNLLFNFWNLRHEFCRPQTAEVFKLCGSYSIFPRLVHVLYLYQFYSLYCLIHSSRVQSLTICLYLTLWLPFLYKYSTIFFLLSFLSRLAILYLFIIKLHKFLVRSLIPYCFVKNSRHNLSDCESLL